MIKKYIQPFLYSFIFKRIYYYLNPLNINLTILISSFDFAVRFKTRNIDATVTTSNEVEFLSQLVIYFDKVCMQVYVTVQC